MHFCYETTSFTAKENLCSVNENYEKVCTINENIILTTKPNYLSCLNLMANNYLNGQMRVTVKKIYGKCNKKSNFFTLKYFMEVYQIRRCRNAGRCVGDVCEKIILEKHLEYYKDEFDISIINTNGFSHCNYGDNWGNCLFFLGGSCIFSKNILRVLNKENIEVFEVFECIDWDIYALIDIETLINNVIQNKQILLTPGVKSKMNELKLTLTSATPITSSLIKKLFVQSTSSLKTAIIQEDVDIPKLR